MTKELKPAHIVILENLNKLLWYPPDISQTDYRRVVKIELLLEILQKIKIEPDKEIVVVLKILANIWQKQKTNYEETIRDNLIKTTSMIAANLIKVLEGKGATGVEIIIDNFFKVANTKKDLSNFHTCLDIALEPCLKYI